MSDDDQERCPCCGSRRVVVRTRSFRLDLVPAFACSGCGAEWRHAWRPYLATAGFYGGGLVGLVAAGISLWTFLAADSETIDWRTWRSVGVAIAIAVGAGWAASRGCTFLRSGPQWVVVERRGRDVGSLNDSYEAQVRAVQTRPSKRSLWTDRIEGAVVFGFLALAAIFGTESRQERLGRETPGLPRGPSQTAIRSLPMRSYSDGSSESKASGHEADTADQPFSEEILRKLEAWKTEAPRRDGGSSYIEDLLRLPTAVSAERGSTGKTLRGENTNPPLPPPDAHERPRSDSPESSTPVSSPYVKAPASTPKE